MVCAVILIQYCTIYVILDIYYQWCDTVRSVAVQAEAAADHKWMPIYPETYPPPPIQLL